MSQETPKPWIKIIGIVIAVILGALMLLEFVYLRGESVASERLRLNEPFTFKVDAPGVPYLVSISADKSKEEMRLKSSLFQQSLYITIFPFLYPLLFFTLFWNRNACIRQNVNYLLIHGRVGRPKTFNERQYLWIQRSF